MRCVEAINRRPCITVATGTALDRAAELMVEAGAGTAVVVDDDGPVGVVSHLDLVRFGLSSARWAAAGPATTGACVDVVMITDVAWIDARRDVGEAFRMLTVGSRHEVVVDERGEPVGVVNLEDLLLSLDDAFDAVAHGPTIRDTPREATS